MKTNQTNLAIIYHRQNHFRVVASYENSKVTIYTGYVLEEALKAKKTWDTQHKDS